MSKKKTPKKKVVVSTTKRKSESEKKVVKTATPTSSKRRTSSSSVKARTNTAELTFGKNTYIWFGIGMGLIALGMLLMSGGQMPDPNTWDENIIYGFRRTVLAPIVILAGIGINIYAIFKK